jgi:hypothetical protein
LLSGIYRRLTKLLSTRRKDRAPLARCVVANGAIAPSSSSRHPKGSARTARRSRGAAGAARERRRHLDPSSSSHDTADPSGLVARRRAGWGTHAHTRRRRRGGGGGAVLEPDLEDRE